MPHRRLSGWQQDSKTLWGWAAGGGLEYAIGHWLVRAEYLHYDLGDLNYNVVDPRTITLAAATNKVSGDIVRGAIFTGPAFRAALSRHGRPSVTAGPR